MNVAKDAGAQPLGLFLPLTKVDVEQRLVYGVATDESPDRSGEICDYASSKPFFERWSGDVSKSTGGKSLGNVRAMHGKTAAGKLTAINFNDQFRAIEVCAKVVDDDEWKKVLEGVYTGFSQGGRYVKRWADEATGLMRYTAEPMEISLVDLPCLPSATFQVIKSATDIEVRPFKAKPVETEKAAAESVETADEGVPVKKSEGEDAEPEQAEVTGELIALAKANPEGPKLRQFWECGCEGADHEHKTLKAASACMRKRKAEEAAKAASAPVTDALGAIAGLLDVEKRKFTDEERKKAAESGTAMSDGSFPIETKDDLENAIHAVGRAKDPDAAKAHIKARAKALGCTDCLPAAWMAGSAKGAIFADLAKYMGESVWDASQAMSTLQTLVSVLQSELWEDEGDPAQIEALRAAIERIKAFVASEILENDDDSDPVKSLEMAVGRLLDLTKAGKRNSGADQARIQKCHDLMKDCGADCGSKASKVVEADAEALAKALAENAAYRDELGKIAPALESIKAEIAKFRNAPVTARAAVNALGFAALAASHPAAQDAAALAIELLGKMSGEERTAVLMKAALATPIDLSKPPQSR